MLVNVTFDPKSRVKIEKMCREALKEVPGVTEYDKHFRKICKWHKKAYSFKGFFRKYEPRKWEYAPNDPDAVFTGIYIVRSADQAESMVNLLTKQYAPKQYAQENYESGDIWYSYGLCDNASQVVNYYKKMKEAGRFPGNHIIALEPMGKGNWRWHKWGTYIGEFEPKREYFSDEVGIKNVWRFEILQVK